MHFCISMKYFEIWTWIYQQHVLVSFLFIPRNIFISCRLVSKIPSQTASRIWLLCAMQCALNLQFAASKLHHHESIMLIYLPHLEMLSQTKILFIVWSNDRSSFENVDNDNHIGCKIVCIIKMKFLSNISSLPQDWW